MNDQAVSSVVSAVLIFGLFSTAFALWTVQSLPEWIEEREHHHAGQTADAFAQASIALVNDGGQADGASVSIPLAPDPVPVVQGAPASGRLDAETGSVASLTMTGESVHMEGGSMLGTADAGGVVAGGSQTVATDVARLDALLLRLQSDRDGEATITVTADGDTVQATLRKEGLTNCGGDGLEVDLETTIDGTASTRTASILCGVGTDVDYTLDLLAAPVPFVSAMERLEGTRSITISAADTDGGGGQNQDTASYAIVWRDSDGAVHVDGGGATRDADLMIDGDALVFEPLYQKFTQRLIHLDLGAVVHIEDSGAAFATTPPFRLAGDAAAPSLDWAVTDLSVDGSLSGRGVATLDVDTLGTDTRVVVVPSGGDPTTVEILGDAAPAWRSHWESEAVLAGLESVVTIEGQGSLARLILDPNAPWTIRMRIADATVQIQ